MHNYAYTTHLRPGCTLPDGVRHSCLSPNPENPTWCGIQHTSRETAQRHADRVNNTKKHRASGDADYHPVTTYRIERYDTRELSYRGWTNDMIKDFLGEPHQVEYDVPYYDADRVHDTERTPAFDFAVAHNSALGLPQVPEDKPSPVRDAVERHIVINLPSIHVHKLLEPARQWALQYDEKYFLREFKSTTPEDVAEAQKMAQASVQESLTMDPHILTVGYLLEQTGYRPYCRRFRGIENRGTARHIYLCRVAWALKKHLPSIACHISDNLRGRGYHEEDRELSLAIPVPVPSQYAQDQPVKYHSITNLRWARITPAFTGPQGTAHWGRTDVVTLDDSDQSFVLQARMPIQ